MSERSERVGGGPEVARPGGYEPPKVAQVLTPAELEEEIRYAGDTTGDPG